MTLREDILVGRIDDLKKQIAEIEKAEQRFKPVRVGRREEVPEAIPVGIARVDVMEINNELISVNAVALLIDTIDDWRDTTKFKRDERVECLKEALSLANKARANDVRGRQEMNKAIAAVLGPFFDFMLAVAKARGLDHTALFGEPLDALKMITKLFEKEVEAAKATSEEMRKNVISAEGRLHSALAAIDQLQNSKLGIDGVKLRGPSSEVQVGIQDPWGEEL